MSYTMNITDKKARRWLESQGIPVTYSSRSSPDFISNNGHGYEVKLLRRKTIVFGRYQFDLLKDFPAITVLVFNQGEFPIYQIPFADIKDEPPYWKGIHIVITTWQDYKSVTQKEITLRRVAHATAVRQGITMKEAVYQALEMWVAKKHESVEESRIPGSS